MGKGLTATICLIALAVTAHAQQPPIVTESWDGRRFQFPPDTPMAFIDSVMKQDALEKAAKEKTFDPRGHWEGTIPGYPGYTSAILIDSELRTTWDDGYGHGWRGYVAHVDSTKVEFIITGGNAVAHADCTIESSDFLHCALRYVDGRVAKNPTFLKRVGPGPKSLMPVIQ